MINKKPVTIEGDLRQRAFALYRPPFRFDGITYIWDADGEMVADDQLEDFIAALGPRVRGWGRMKYLKDPDDLHTAVGHLIAEAMMKLWQAEASGRGAGGKDGTT